MYKRNHISGWRIRPSSTPAVVTAIKSDLSTRFGNMHEVTEDKKLVIYPFSTLFPNISGVNSCTIMVDYGAGTIKFNSGNLADMQNMYYSWDHYMNDICASIKKAIFQCC